MKIDLKRAIEVLAACGYECDELEAMRQDCQPVAWAYTEFGEIKDLSLCDDNGYTTPLYSEPKPLRELSRKEIMKLWNRAWEESSSVHQVEHFAKLVRGAK
jgi:hypothetical protein